MYGQSFSPNAVAGTTLSGAGVSSAALGASGYHLLALILAAITLVFAAVTATQLVRRAGRVRP
jgi:hypothetical protein